MQPSLIAVILIVWLCLIPRGAAADGGADSPLIVLDPSCQLPAMMEPPLPPGNPAPGTKRMAERLAQLRGRMDPTSTPFFSDLKAALLTRALTNSTDVRERVRLQYELALVQADAGRPDAALNSFAALERLVSSSGGNLPDRTRKELQLRKAVAFLRLGEQENCLAHHNAESCLFPLVPQAYHHLPRGSRGAITLLTNLLAEVPADLSVRWLLNVAHMTLGEYPEGVPVQWRIPPKVFASEHEMPQFPDVADALDLDVNDLAGGVIVDDFDNDGFLDIMASAWGMNGQLRYFHNNGDGTFAQRTSEAGLVGLTSGLNLMQTDYNNDGWLDIWVLRGAWLGKAGRLPNSLLRNNGDGTFTDVTEEAGLLSFHPTQASVWFDYDGDGWLDLFIGNESDDEKDPDYCELYHNNHDGTFTECAAACGLKIAQFVKGVASADYDNDGRPDLYLSIRDRPNLLFHNDGPGASESGSPGRWHFHDVTRPAGVAKPIESFPTWFFDYDNDGWEDLFVSGYFLPKGVGDVAADYLGLPHEAPLPKLYRNNHDGTFVDVTASVRLNRICLTMGCNFGDLDNDGWLDFYLGVGNPDLATIIPNRLFRNAGGRVFQDVTTATGMGHLQKGHGVAFADLDNDGDQDVYVVMGGAYPGSIAHRALFLNPGNTNRWLKLQLVGTRSNRAAIGARIKVTVQTPGGSRDIYKTVNSGGSFGANPLRQEFGLADATAITSVAVQWPASGTQQRLTGLELDRAYRVREGDDRAEPLKLKRLKFPTTPTQASPPAPTTGG